MRRTAIRRSVADRLRCRRFVHVVPPVGQLRADLCPRRSSAAARGRSGVKCPQGGSATRRSLPAASSATRLDGRYIATARRYAGIFARSACSSLIGTTRKGPAPARDGRDVRVSRSAAGPGDLMGHSAQRCSLRGRYACGPWPNGRATAFELRNGRVSLGGAAPRATSTW
jgi:hypothetical protein